MNEVFDSLKKGLTEALTHARSEDVGAVVHDVRVPEPYVAAIRAKSGLSQREFAQCRRAATQRTSPAKSKSGSRN